jgi:hypothetical protein
MHFGDESVDVQTLFYVTQRFRATQCFIVQLNTLQGLGVKSG